MIGSSSARIKERLTDGDVVVVEVFREPLLGQGLLGELVISLCDEVVVGLITCGGVLIVRVASSSAAVRVFLVHDIKEEEGERQKEVQEAKGDEERERESEADGEVGEKVTQRAHGTWR